ncbi:MAG: STAS domain-containing protein [Candidatus Omnitrophota bacterium]
MTLITEIKEQQDGVYVVKPAGNLDSDTYLSFEDKIKSLLEPSTKVLIMDLSKLKYISSIGLGLIFKTRKTIEGNSGTFILTSIPLHIKKIFDVVKALPKEPIFGSMKEVDEYLKLIQQQEIEKQQNS